MKTLEDKLAGALLGLLTMTHLKGAFDRKVGKQAQELAEQALKEYKEGKTSNIYGKIAASINHLPVAASNPLTDE